MKSIVVWSRKGGVGKTTVALHLIWYFSQVRKLRVLAVDLDIQANTTAMLQNTKVRCSSPELFTSGFDPSVGAAQEASPGEVHLIRSDPAIRRVESMRLADAVHAFRASWAKLKDDFDVAVLDCPPSEHVAVVAALMTVEYGLAPIDVGQWSIEGIQPMLRIYLGIKQKYNPALSFLGMLPCRVDNRVVMAKDALEKLAGVYGRLLFPMKLSQRSAIGAVAVRGEPVWADRSAGDAAAEVLAVCSYVAGTVFPEAHDQEAAEPNS